MCVRQKNEKTKEINFPQPIPDSSNSILLFVSVAFTLPEVALKLVTVKVMGCFLLL